MVAFVPTPSSAANGWHVCLLLAFVLRVSCFAIDSVTGQAVAVECAAQPFVLSSQLALWLQLSLCVLTICVECSVG